MTNMRIDWDSALRKFAKSAVNTATVNSNGDSFPISGVAVVEGDLSELLRKVAAERETPAFDRNNIQANMICASVYTF